MADNILELRNIGKTYSGVNVLRNINLGIERGEVHALLGENGAGKSTLIKIISGYIQPDKGGEILVNGKPVVFKQPGDSMDAGVHTIYQELSLCLDMTVAENIVIDKQKKFPGLLQDKAGYNKLAQETLDRLGVNISPKAIVRGLSIAQQQIVEIAKAISADAQLILMDEPTSSISQKDADKLLEIVRNLRDQGVTVIYISHRLQEIGQIADRVTVLRDGDYVDTVDAKTSTTEDYIHMMVGRQMTNVYPKKELELGEVVLEVEDLCSDVFEHVSFKLRKREILGVGGLVGAKRTELMECLFGLRPIKSGKIYVHGKEYKPTDAHNAIKNKFAFVTEDRKKTGLVLCSPVYENINMVNVDRMHKAGVLNWRELKNVARKHRERLNIRLANLGQPASSLSGGNQQKVALSKWLDFQPDILLFDEPTRGIDIGAKTEIYTIMGELAEQGISIIMVSSELPELISVTDEIVVMCEGRMTGLISHEEATQEKVMALATASIVD